MRRPTLALAERQPLELPLQLTVRIAELWGVAGNKPGRAVVVREDARTHRQYAVPGRE
jgi:hypothetical protein